VAPKYGRRVLYVIVGLSVAPILGEGSNQCFDSSMRLRGLYGLNLPRIEELCSAALEAGAHGGSIIAPVKGEQVYHIVYPMFITSENGTIIVPGPTVMSVPVVRCLSCGKQAESLCEFCGRCQDCCRRAGCYYGLDFI
jgi:hypothetical protein